MAKILIIDDAATDRQLIGTVVRSVGHDPVFGTDGSEAVSLAESSRPSLIFLDVVMPGMNGFNACRALKKNAATASIPVVLVTSKNEESDLFWGKKQGADGHVSKPFTPEQLTSLIARFVA